MSNKNLDNPTAHKAGSVEKKSELHGLPGNKPSNTDPTSDTASQGNELKRVVSVGRNPEQRKISLGGK